MANSYDGCLLNFTRGPEKVTDYAALTQTKLMTHSLWMPELPPDALGKGKTAFPNG
jgi:hypothetical protein